MFNTFPEEEWTSSNSCECCVQQLVVKQRKTT